SASIPSRRGSSTTTSSASPRGRSSVRCTLAGKFTREVNKLARAKWQERPAYAKLSNEQKKFVDFYAGNIKEAAEKAGVSYDRAKKFMRQWTVQAALKERDEWEEELQAKAPKKRRVYTRLELQEFWTSVIMDQTEDMEIRLRAADALARSKAMFVNRLDRSEERRVGQDCSSRGQRS